MKPRSYVEISRPHSPAPGRLDSEVRFAVSSRARAHAHRSAALRLAGAFDLEYVTPWRVNPRWSIYKEQTEGIRYGAPDERRLQVSGPEGTVTQFLAALPPLLEQLEAAATRAARAFGSWRRSAAAEAAGHLDYEDAGTLRIRAQQFHTDVLAHLVGFLGEPAPGVTADRDGSRPLWEQSKAVAAEVWAGVPMTLRADAAEKVPAGCDQDLLPWLPMAPLRPSVPSTVEELLRLAGSDPAPAEPGLRLRQDPLPTTADRSSARSSTRAGVLEVAP